MKKVVMTWSTRHQRMLLENTAGSKRTKQYQKSHEILLKDKERMKFLWTLILLQDRDLNMLKMTNERRRKNKENPRPDKAILLTREWKFKALKSTQLV